MWREGFNIDLVMWSLNALALACGAGLGLRALLNPKWSARFVRLAPDDQGGGQAEFRATYGGVFFGLHAIAFLLSWSWITEGDVMTGLMALGAAATLAAGWFGAACGRFIAMWRDGADTKFNRISAVTEFVFGVLIAGPGLAWLVQRLV